MILWLTFRIENIEESPCDTSNGMRPIHITARRTMSHERASRTRNPDGCKAKFSNSLTSFGGGTGSSMALFEGARET